MNKQKLKRLIQQVPELIETAEVCREVGLPNFYIAGGAITQIIWNNIESKSLLAQVKDFDVVYFDSSSHVTEDEFKNRISSRLSHSVEVDVKTKQSYMSATLRGLVVPFRHMSVLNKVSSLGFLPLLLGSL